MPLLPSSSSSVGSPGFGGARPRRRGRITLSSLSVEEWRPEQRAWVEVDRVPWAAVRIQRRGEHLGGVRLNSAGVWVYDSGGEAFVPLQGDQRIVADRLIRRASPEPERGSISFLDVRRVHRILKSIMLTLTIAAAVAAAGLWFFNVEHALQALCLGALCGYCSWLNSRENVTYCGADYAPDGLVLRRFDGGSEPIPTGSIRQIRCGATSIRLVLESGRVIRVPDTRGMQTALCTLDAWRENQRQGLAGMKRALWMALVGPILVGLAFEGAQFGGWLPLELRPGSMVLRSALVGVLMLVLPALALVAAFMLRFPRSTRATLRKWWARWIGRFSGSPAASAP